MSQDICPDCGTTLKWTCGIGECLNCGYTDVLSPCMCCDITCITKTNCRTWMNWHRLYGDKK